MVERAAPGWLQHGPLATPIDSTVPDAISALNLRTDYPETLRELRTALASYAPPNPLNSSSNPNVQRDETTQRYFNGNVTAFEGAAAGDIRAPKYALGDRTFSLADIAELTGAPDGTRIYVHRHSDDQLYVSGTNPDVFLGRQGSYLTRTANGELRLDRDFMVLANPGAGLGTRILATQVRAAERFGVSRITTDAGGSAAPTSLPFNGYYTWPRLGFSAQLEGEQIDALKSARVLPQNFTGALSLNDLLYPDAASGQNWDAGAAQRWWREHGEGTQMEFDVTPGSRSRQILENYLRERNIQL
jgi:hypothetical protein